MTIKTSIISGDEARQKMQAGAKKVKDPVASSLGPSGKNVAIAYRNEQGIYGRIIVHDGVTIARAIELEDENENFGAQIIKEAARKTVDKVGDGTTCATILSYAILEEINRLVVAGYDPMLLRKGVENAVKQMVSEIEKISIPVKTLEQKKQIATVSAQDPELGELVAKIVDEMGIDGLVLPESSSSPITTVEKQSGFQFDKGWAAPEFMTNPDRGEATVENAYILITDGFLNDLELIKPLLNDCAKNNRKLVIIASNFSLIATGNMVANKMNGVISSLLIEAPSFGANQKNILQDIAIFTRAKFFSQSTGFKIEDATIADLGRCEYVKSTKNDTIIAGGIASKEEMNMRIAEIKKQMEIEELEFDQDKMKERLARLTSGVAVIRVGGTTEVEMKERLERVKDSILATKAAVRGGIVPGGEVVYLVVRQKLDQKDIAQNVLYKALYQPFKTLLNNASMNDGAWYEKLMNSGKEGKKKWIFSRDSGLTAQDLKKFNPDDPDQMLLVNGDISEAVKIIGTPMKNGGVNVVKRKIVDMLNEGIIDPAFVPIEALKNAASAAILKATTGFIIIQKDIDKK